MSGCDACAAAERDRLSGLYRAGCQECAARMLARGPAMRTAQQAGYLTDEYKHLLRQAFGSDWTAGHERVKAWAKKLGKTCG